MMAAELASESLALAAGAQNCHLAGVPSASCPVPACYWVGVARFGSVFLRSEEV
ncbi:hypothetical protein [Rothia uropygialis]|uniref:hypothetical protein n=1 Tax=Kocuria sp. 36 TaxID=1415402 RepID=UPI0013EA7A97|nr:hypothetical protein [Kocuria sp. 36]